MKYPIGIQDFSELINGKYVYVDKTEHIFNLVDSGKYYFLSRPRRFGKSLLLSTMRYYFEGRRELFHGLKIEQLEQDWTEYPVMHLDINSGRYSEQGTLEAVLNRHLIQWEQAYGTGEGETTLSLRFSGVIRRAAEKTGRNVVILIDEYDKPMLETVSREMKELHEDHRATLKAFYSVLKTEDRYIRFALMTGVTKFAHVSIFSDLNNLRDISQDRRYYDICGLTEQELHNYFSESVDRLAEANQMTPEEAYQKLKYLYDGYHFNPDRGGVYNPFSVLNAFDSGTFANFWAATGTPSFLVELLQEAEFDLENLTDRYVTASALANIDQMRQDPIGILYQSGYLTIAEYIDDARMYRLRFPNREVEESLLEFIIPYYTSARNGQGSMAIYQIRKDAEAGRAEEMIERLRCFFNEGDYRVAGRSELYFQNAMFIILRLLGLQTHVEQATSKGRIDLTLETRDYVYLMEFKVDQPAEEAIRQIEERGYAERYAGDPRQLIRIGVTFGSRSRTIDDYKVV